MAHTVHQLRRVRADLRRCSSQLEEERQVDMGLCKEALHFPPYPALDRVLVGICGVVRVEACCLEVVLHHDLVFRYVPKSTRVSSQWQALR